MIKMELHMMPHNFQIVKIVHIVWNKIKIRLSVYYAKEAGFLEFLTKSIK